MVDFDIDKVCRVCLQADLEVSFLFDEKNSVNGVCLSDMISECTMYTLRRFDGFPDLICYDCMERVRNAYAFKKQYEKSHRKLISFLEETKFVVHEEPSATNDKCIQTDDTSLYPCEKCDEKFTNYERLREHRSVAHKGTANLCRLCSKIFNRIADLKNHIAVCHPESGLVTSNECTVCRKKFIRKDHVIRHLRKVHKLPAGTEASKELNENFKFEATRCHRDGSDILDEAEIDMVQEPYADVLSASDPVDGPEVGKHETDTPEHTVIDSGFDREAKFEIESNYDPGDGDGDECFSDGFDEPNSLSSEEDEKPLSALISPNAANHKDITTVKVEPGEVINDTTMPGADLAQTDKTAAEQQLKPSSKRRFKCSQCDKVFTRSNHVKRHLLSHSQEKPFSCHICNKRFNRADHLKIHTASHNSEKQFKCYSCDRSFSRSDQLNRHRKQHHGSDKLARSEFCMFCNRSFSSKYYLQKHMRVHTEKNWKCKFCEIEFHSKESLKEHTKSHSTDKPFLCSECGQCFIRKDYLLIHMRRHNGEKPYKCKYCEKGFPRATDLKVHERYHTGEKTHLCTTCGKGFQRGYNLVVHMRVHTGERPYQCPHCPKNFSQGNDLKVHVRRHTGERFKCQICGTEFMQGYNLTQHNLTVHGIEDKSRKGRVAKVKSEHLSQELTSDVATMEADKS